MSHKTWARHLLPFATFIKKIQFIFNSKFKSFFFSFLSFISEYFFQNFFNSLNTLPSLLFLHFLTFTNFPWYLQNFRHLITFLLLYPDSLRISLNSKMFSKYVWSSSHTTFSRTILRYKEIAIKIKKFVTYYCLCI